MKIRRLTSAFVLGLALAACGDETGITAADLQGTWNATVIEYTDNADAQNVVDLIVRDGASFTLTVDAAGSAATLFTDGVGGSSSDSGTLSSNGTTLTLAGDVFAAARNGDTLTLLNPDEEFDFGSGSEVPATLRIVLMR